MMTLEEIHEVINNIKHPRIDNLRVNPLAMVKGKESSQIQIWVGFNTLDRDDVSKEFVIGNECTVDRKDLNKHFLIKIIRELLFTLALHEIDELYEYKGKRLYDPHKDRNFSSIIYALGDNNVKYKMGIANRPEYDLMKKKKGEAA